MTVRPRRAPRMLPALVCCVLVGLGALTGCGGDRTSVGPEMSPLQVAPPPPGAPVRVMIWTPASTADAVSYPDLPLVAQAFADLVNTEGGVNGRPLVVVSCDEHGEAAGASRCAEQAVRDKVLAVVGSYSAHAPAYLPVLEAAGVPYLGGVALNVADLTSPISFPVTGGPWLLVVGGARLAATQGCRAVSLVQPDVASVPESVVERYVRAGLASGGATLASVIELPSGPGPLAEQATRATQSGDCVLLATGDQGTQRFLAAYQQLGATQRLYTVGGGQTAGVAAQFPDLSSRAFRTDAVAPVGNGVWRRYREALARYPRAPEIDATGTVQRQTWTAFEVFLQVARQLTKFDSGSMLAALRSADAVDTGGLVPALNFTRDASVPGLGRLFNPTVTYQRFEDGRFTELRPGFEDLAPVLAAAGR